MSKINRPFKAVTANGWTEILGPRNFGLLTTKAGSKELAIWLNEAYALGWQDAQLSAEQTGR